MSLEDFVLISGGRHVKAQSGDAANLGTMRA